MQVAFMLEFGFISLKIHQLTAEAQLKGQLFSLKNKDLIIQSKKYFPNVFITFMSPLGKALNGKIPNKHARDAENNFCWLQQITSVHFKLLSTQIA